MCVVGGFRRNWCVIVLGGYLFVTQDTSGLLDSFLDKSTFGRPGWRTQIPQNFKLLALTVPPTTLLPRDTLSPPRPDITLIWTLHTDPGYRMPPAGLKAKLRVGYNNESRVVAKAASCNNNGKQFDTLLKPGSYAYELYIFWPQRHITPLFTTPPPLRPPRTGSFLAM